MVTWLARRVFRPVWASFRPPRSWAQTSTGWWSATGGRPPAKFAKASHQTCVAHLLRHCHEMIADAAGDAEQAQIPAELRGILLDAVCVRERNLEGDALAEAVAALKARVETLCAHTSTGDPDRRMVTHVTKENDHLFTF